MSGEISHMDFFRRPAFKELVTKYNATHSFVLFKMCCIEYVRHYGWDTRIGDISKRRLHNVGKLQIFDVPDNDFLELLFFSFRAPN